MAQFCTKCGVRLNEGMRFCTACGAVSSAPAAPAAQAPAARAPVAPVAQPPAAAALRPAPAAPAPAASSGSPILKIVLAVLGVMLVLVLVSIGAGVYYYYYHIKPKVTKIENTVRSFPIPAGTPQAPTQPAAPGGEGSSPGGGPGSAPQNPAPPIDINRLLQQIGKAAGPGNNASDAAKLANATSLPGMGGEIERTVGGPEADLLVRVGAVNNFGFGWPLNFDPFSGDSTPPHDWPWTPPPGSPEGTKRILLGSVLTPRDTFKKYHDGYSHILQKCAQGPQVENVGPCLPREASMPVPIGIAVGDLPAKVQAVVFQMFVDDFQAPVMYSHFQVSLNGTRIPPFEEAINSLDQTGPIGKLVSLSLLPEYWPLLQSGTVNLLIDDPTTHAPDGYAIDFVRILVNPHGFKYQVSLEASVVDADKHSSIAGATVAAALATATTDHDGHCTLQGLPAGLVTAMASAPGYDASSVPVDLVAGQTGNAKFQLHPHQEGTAALEKSIAETGSATVYGIHFDTDSAKLRPDSAPALAAILGLMNNHPGSRWIIAGHTDNQGGAEHNQMLSEARAASVVSWLKAHAVTDNRLVPQGFGASRPVADNATDNGRALNRRVEIAPAK